MDDLEDYRNQLIETKASESMLKSALATQTAAIDAITVDRDASVEALNKWKALPVEVKYVEVYKYIPLDVNLTRGDCNDTKKLIDSIRSIDLNRL